MTKQRESKGVGDVVAALALSNGFSVGLYGIRVLVSDSFRHWFLLWNLLLAAFPLLLAWWLTRRLHHGKWLHPFNVLLGVLWLGFLPNSFYLVTDLVHFGSTGEVSMLYDAVMYCSFIFNGFALGFMSVHLVHRALLTRLSRLWAHTAITGVILASSFAIYLGRYLRWNTWDILIQPDNLFFDVTGRILRPQAYPQAVTTTFLFFALIGVMYIVLWRVTCRQKD